MMKLVVISAVLVLGLCTVLGAQTLGVGSALRGRVVTADGSLTPIAGAVVIARRSDDGMAKVTLSDDLGRFEFNVLPNGKYSLTAHRASYLDSQYGTIAWPGIGVELLVRPGGNTDDVTILMPRGGVITGIVRSEKGIALPDVRVIAYIVSATGAMSAVTTGVTDDTGRYRLFGLPPGTYLVATRPPEDSKTVQLFGQAEIDSAFARLARGVFQDAPANTPEVAAAMPIFYPAASDASAAVPVKVGLSEVRTGIDIDLRIVEPAEVLGTALGPNGPVAGARITVDSIGTPINIRSLVATTAADGSFRIGPLSPGDYLIRGTTTPAIESLRPNLNLPSRRVLVATEPLSVGPGAKPRILLTFSAGRSLTGRLIGASREVLSKGEAVVAMPVIGPATAARAVAPVKQDGTFRIDGLFPSKYTLDAIGLPSGLVLVEMKTATGLRLDQSIDLTQETSLEVVLAVAPGSTVRGTVTLPSSEPVSGYAVVIFPQSTALRQVKRLTRLARTGGDGVFQFDSLPPGEYLLSAFVGLGALPDETADFLDAAERTAVKVTVGLSSTVSIDLVTGKRNQRP